jgi:hypothetical protein
LSPAYFLKSIRVVLLNDIGDVECNSLYRRNAY